MLAKLIAGVAVVASFQAGADEAATKVTGDELRTLVTGAKVFHEGNHNANRRWTNEPDGVFVASASATNSMGAVARSVSAPGKWSISDDEKYCIEIDWRRQLEQWCSFIVKSEDGAYYLGKVDPARRIEFAK